MFSCHEFDLRKRMAQKLFQSKRGKRCKMKKKGKVKTEPEGDKD